VKKLQDVFRKAMEHPDHVKEMEKAGLAIKVMVGDEYEKYYRDLHAKMAVYTQWARSRPGAANRLAPGGEPARRARAVVSLTGSERRWTVSFLGILP
jgi:hypothetical protein